MQPAMEGNLRVTSVSPNYTFIFSFEKDFDKHMHLKWMQNNWHRAFYYGGVYVAVVFGIQLFMQAQSPFKLRRALVVWNLLLSVFSIFGAWRTLPELIHVLREFGFSHSVCNPSFIEDTKVSGFWTWMFTLSKLPELGDTLFIVLRKQRLIFLHWYHHVSVLLFSWYSYSQHIAPARWFVVMNYLVHSVMYAYYAMRAMRMSVPKPVAMSITTLQILQMVFGCFVSYWAMQIKLNGDFCQVSIDTAKLAILMYLSYFILFGRFFYSTYMGKQGMIRKAE